MAKLNKGESDTVRKTFRFISSERREDIDEYVLKPLVDYIQNMDFKAMVTPEKIVNYVVSAIGVAKYSLLHSAL